MQRSAKENEVKARNKIEKVYHNSKPECEQTQVALKPSLTVERPLPRQAGARCFLKQARQQERAGLQRDSQRDRQFEELDACEHAAQVDGDCSVSRRSQRTPPQ